MGEDEIKILWLSANPRRFEGIDLPRLSLEEECGVISKALNTGDFHKRFQFIAHPAARRNDIQGLLLDWKPHIVHFSGHGDPAGLMLTDDQGEGQVVSSQIIELLFSVLKDNLRCVILSACYTDQQAEAIANHVDCVVGMAGEIPDEAARGFAVGFYRALAYGRDVRTAFDLGRIEAENAIPDSRLIAQLLAPRVDPSSVILVLSDEVQRARAKRLEDLAVTLPELDRNLRTFYAPSRINLDDYLLSPARMLWIIGPPGIGKRTIALHLARKVGGHEEMTLPAKSIYSMSRFESWTLLEELDIHNAVILLPDALGSVAFERDQIEKEMTSLMHLIDKQNTIIVTSPDDVYEEALETMPRLSEDILGKGKILQIDVDAYQYKDKEKIYQKLLHHAHESGLIGDLPYQYGQKLMNIIEGTYERTSVITQAHALFGKRLREAWLPIDLERFVFSSLPAVNNERDFLLQLQREADIEQRIQAWFLALDENTRCFLLTLSIFLGSKEPDLWTRHRAIIKHLQHLNSSLALLPLGILRHQAEPYVTESGMLDFTNPNVYYAMVKVITYHYREYLTEILPLLKEWSVPESASLPNDNLEGSEEVKRQKRREAWHKVIQETETDRKAIVRFIGEAAKHDLDLVLGIIEIWAGHHRDPIAQTAGIALRETATDPIAVSHVLSCLHQWATNFDSDKGRYYRWSASSALWRIGLIKTRRDLQEAAMKYLQKLARDPDEYVRASVVYAAGRLVGTIPLSQLKPLVHRLALTKWRNEAEFPTAQRRMLQVIDRITSVDPQGDLTWIDSWYTADSDFARWCAVGALLYCRNLPDSVRYPKLLDIIPTHIENFSRVLSEIPQNDDSDQVRQVFNKLIAEKPQGYREELTKALLSASINPQMEMQQIRNFIGSLNDPRLYDILGEVEFRIWNTRTVDTVRKAGAQELLLWLNDMFAKNQKRTLQVLLAVAQPGPSGCREQLVQKLADGANEAPEKYSAMNMKLTECKNPTIDQLRIEINRKRYGRLVAWLRRIFGMDL